MYLTFPNIIRRILRILYIAFFGRPNFKKSANDDFKVAIIGGGFSGIAMAVNLQKRGFHNFTIFEKAEDVGGVWLKNKYPGAGCDIGSHLYSFSFALNFNWSKLWSPRKEIWEYIRKVVDDFKLKSKIKYNTEVVSCTWEANNNSWKMVEKSIGLTGEQNLFKIHNFNIVIRATGGQSIPKIPNFKGISKFKKPNFHTANWDESIDLTGKRVSIVGTGASAVQLVPAIAEKVKELHVFQRSATWVPKRKVNRKYGDHEKLVLKCPIFIRFYRNFWYLTTEIQYYFAVVQSQVSIAFEKLLAKGMLNRLNPEQTDSENLEKLIPNYIPGCKRITPSSVYLETFNRENVFLVSENIVEITEKGIITENKMSVNEMADKVARNSISTEADLHALDVIIWSTGFNMMTCLTKMSTIGNNGKDIREIWGDSPQMFLGATHPNLPNMFQILGPNTRLTHNSEVFMIECGVEYVCDCLVELMDGKRSQEKEKEEDLTVCSPRTESEKLIEEKKCRTMVLKKEVLPRFMKMIEEKSVGKAFSGGCDSWYKNERGVVWTLWPRSSVAYWWWSLICQREDYHFE